MKAINNLSVYFIGIGGSGMMPLALMAARCGYRVGGSDRKLDAGKRGALKKAGIVVHSPPDANQIQDQDFVVYSSAIRRDHPEYVRASQRIDTTDMRLMHRMQFLNECLSRYTCQFAVAGTHGKTSTASMLGWALLQLKLQPGILVGGRPIYLPDGIHAGPGDCAVYETDESDGSFLESRARFRLVLNADHDHLEYYGTFEALLDAFERFIAAGELTAVNGDDAALRNIVLQIDPQLKKSLLWFLEETQWQQLPDTLRNHPRVFRAEVLDAPSGTGLPQARICEAPDRIIGVPLPGRHYLSNALGVYALLDTLRGSVLPKDVTSESLAASLASFPGVERRMQKIGMLPDALFYDDYGHHPTEIRAVLHAFRQLTDAVAGRLVAVFQPHRYTRTQKLAGQFAEALQLADVVLVMPLYPAGEDPISGVDENSVVRALEDCMHNRKGPCKAVTRLADFSAIKEHLQKGDQVICLGAGDISAHLHDYVREHGRLFETSMPME